MVQKFLPPRKKKQKKQQTINEMKLERIKESNQKHQFIFISNLYSLVKTLSQIQDIQKNLISLNNKQKKKETFTGNCN